MKFSTSSILALLVIAQLISVQATEEPSMSMAPSPAPTVSWCPLTSDNACRNPGQDNLVEICLAGKPLCLTPEEVNTARARRGTCGYCPWVVSNVKDVTPDTCISPTEKCTKASAGQCCSGKCKIGGDDSDSDDDRKLRGGRGGDRGGGFFRRREPPAPKEGVCSLIKVGFDDSSEDSDED